MLKLKYNSLRLFLYSFVDSRIWHHSTWQWCVC
jgi:hypothetical protein